MPTTALSATMDSTSAQVPASPTWSSATVKLTVNRPPTPAPSVLPVITVLASQPFAFRLQSDLTVSLTLLTATLVPAAQADIMSTEVFAQSFRLPMPTAPFSPTAFAPFVTQVTW